MSECNYTEQILEYNPGDPVPLLFIDVNISSGETKRISIYDGDTPESLAI